ncbi:sigma-70 family RNA polymerase sigma factor [Chitinophagaceae bacterium LB-8]|uniref:Sigma-70 family RNA polymerase sigma factor n=1 Tax=Paraflavisolibacter caeni TaxID=2982496 RepID=A0A9X3B6K7_9BACT|nr:sigma-70 family RNA polymerase sigma factor [Paraflavisolibacter caeni]MCU7548180.1 sigma-70 family RNA polymerase sigma factor [Paraflavisolibacter caeni]
MHPDQKYIDALLNNDRKLLGELYQKCFPIIRNMVVQNKGTEANAADIFQEALVDLFKIAKARQLTLQFSICAYIKGMCTNKWRDELKKSNSEGVTFTDFDRQDDIGEDYFKVAEEHNLKQARLNLIKKKLNEMGESCKELIRLSWARNAAGKRISTEEIAKALHITEGYARKKKSECIVKLMRLVMDDPEYRNLKH